MLYEFLVSNKKRDNYPFHMPGHKQNLAFLPLGFNFLEMDITEIPGSDNLHSPKGLIRDAQQKMSLLCGANASFMLVNGSSCGVMAAILSVCADGDEIIMARNSHISAYHALLLSGAKPVYIAPEFTEYGLPYQISTKKLEEALLAHPRCKAVFVTSPTYEGFCSPIKEIADLVHQNGKILIVDEAHGAHFGLHSYFPPSANTLGADLVIQSLHKTLAVPNQCALLHVNNNAVDEELLKRILSMLQTTSPSYILLAMMEQAAEALLYKPHLLMDPYVSLLQHFREGMANCKAIRLLSEKNMDLGKLVFLLQTSDISAKGLYTILAEKYGLQLEMAGFNHVIAMTSYADTHEGFDLLLRAMQLLDKDLNFSTNFTTIKLGNKIPKQILLPKEAYRKKRMRVLPEQAMYQISGDFVVPYPPGIPLLAPGEEIGPHTLEELTKLGLGKEGIIVCSS